MIFFSQKSLNKLLLFTLIFSILLFDIPVAKATTVEELWIQILKLQAKIVELKKQLAEIQLLSPVKRGKVKEETKSQQPKSEVWCHHFEVNLKYKGKGKEVKALQIALRKERLFNGPATGYFGPLTFQSVKLFQEKYQKEILTPLKLKRGTGFVGIATRSKLNELYGCHKVSLSTSFPQQGDTLLIKVKSPSGNKIEGKLDSQKIEFFKLKGNWIGIAGISIRKRVGKHHLLINFPEGKTLKREIIIRKRKFPITEFLVTKELRERGYTPSKIKKNIAKENSNLYQVLQIFTPIPYFSQFFIYPLKEKEVKGDFGNIRKSGSIILRHLGVDLKANLGTPVYAINQGIVRYSQQSVNYGKTIIIDHGMGIFSLYLHLNEFKVFEGNKVKRGEIIGLSGNTGYSIQPHLHFSVKINSISVDPLKFIEIMEKGIK